MSRFFKGNPIHPFNLGRNIGDRCASVNIGQRRISSLVDQESTASANVRDFSLSLFYAHEVIIPLGISTSVAPEIRLTDADGRIKFARGSLLSDLRGWQRGCLAVVYDGRITDRVKCNARASAFVGQFWETLGFVLIALVGITHIRDGAAR